MELWGMTDKGAVRNQNQDVYRTLYDEEKHLGVMVVCDGMGGAKAGNVASRLAADHFMESLMKHIAADIDELSLAMEDAVTDANDALFRKSLSDLSCSGMGTTLVAAAVTDGGTVVVNVGDSRAYLIRNAHIEQITKDHSVVEDMVRRGDITREEAKSHPNKNLITRALGTGETVTADVFRPELKAGDILLLCSDGLSNTVEDSELRDLSCSGNDIRAACEKLKSLSLQRGAPDNITVALMRV